MDAQEKQEFFDKVKGEVVRLKLIPDMHFECDGWSGDHMEGIMYPKGFPDKSFEAHLFFYDGFADWEFVFDQSTPYSLVVDAPPVVLPLNTPTNCLHPNKRKVSLIHTAYMYCPDCKADLGDCK